MGRGDLKTVIAMGDGFFYLRKETFFFKKTSFLMDQGDFR